METKRLYLREIEEDDSELIVRWRSDPAIYKFFKSPHRIVLEEHLNWFRKIYQGDHNRTDYMCIEKASEKKIGVFGLIFEGDKVEVSYLLAPEAQHKGFAAEAIYELIEMAKKEHGSKQVVAEINKDNESSINFVQKMGFSIVAMNGDFLIYGKEL